MRSAEEVRDWMMTRVGTIVRRPSGFTRCGQDTQTILMELLGCLLYQDGLEPPSPSYGKYGQLGIAGAFDKTFSPGRYQSEVASILAETIHIAGYLPLPHTLTLTPEAMTQLAATAHEQLEGVDLRRSDVEAIIGPPSLVIGDDRVACYAPADRRPGWIYLDYVTERISSYEPGKGRMRHEILHEQDPLVRSIRLPAPTWEDGLVLSLYGKDLRWGTGWWIHHPSPKANPTTDAIATQLRIIQHQDPSQAGSS